MRTSLDCKDVSACPHKDHINCLKAGVETRDEQYGYFSAGTITRKFLLLMENVTDSFTFVHLFSVVFAHLGCNMCREQLI